VISHHNKIKKQKKQKIKKTKTKKIRKQKTKKIHLHIYEVTKTIGITLSIFFAYNSFAYFYYF